MFLWPATFVFELWLLFSPLSFLPSFKSMYVNNFFLSLLFSGEERSMFRVFLCIFLFRLDFFFDFFFFVIALIVLVSCFFFLLFLFGFFKAIITRRDKVDVEHDKVKLDPPRQQ